MASTKLPGLILQGMFITDKRSIRSGSDFPCVACRIMDDQQREQKERYESQVEGLRLKVEHLQNESSKLQNLFQEKSNINETIREEVSRLSSENSVCSSSRVVYDRCVSGQFSPISRDPQVIPELRQQVTELQRQKQELEANVQEQRRELAGKYELFLKNIFFTF